MEISRLGSDARSYFETFIRSPEQFLN